ncbi:sugar MFS transporter [Runella slithyformis]|uniref:Glucose/galactose transporter n=1 Tax=Runella slithyformis (strain ATCC 29530 / DSM 19594 / LMG 11500 / NCIMB 11436 / LSU 4) TaxID=761193 RepID=A0A7U4E7R6_RUNSL|nr:sugar MFS transporter [Runella slithyformis]AEI50936.1 glucose/galactose transporter [Runella slithyformis DSM 19594]
MSKPKQSYVGPLIIIGLLFFVFGFVTWVNGTLITFFKKAFSLDNTSSYLVTFAFFISYTVMAIPSSEVLKRTGFKRGMSLGLGIMAVGTLIFIPAARIASYPLFLGGLFTIGIGLTLLQTASNPYATILGPRESAAQRISFLGIANKLAGIFSQRLFGGLLLASGAAATPQDELQKVETPYLILTAVLVVLAGVIWFSKGLPEVSEEQEEAPGNAVKVNRTSVFSFPNLVLGVIALFCYVGVEVISGDTIINYGVSMGFSESEASTFGTYTLWSMLAAYGLGIVLIPKYVSQVTCLRASAILGIVGTVLAVTTGGFTSVLCIAFLGFANALVWPAMWPLALDGLGKFTKTGSALLIMGISGGAILPLIYGNIADSIQSTQQAYWVMMPLYLFILYYAFIGYKKRSW